MAAAGVADCRIEPDSVKLRKSGKGGDNGKAGPTTTRRVNRPLDLLLIISVLNLSAWVSGGLFMLLAPRRFGNFVHENFMCFPKVGARDWGKKLFLRLAGAGLLVLAVHTVPRILELFRTLGP